MNFHDIIVLRQHELYYEAKSSIVFRPNILNTSAQRQSSMPNPLLRHNSSRTEEIATEKQPTLQAQNSVISESPVQASTTVNQPNNEQNTTTETTTATAEQQTNTIPHQVHAELSEEQVAERQHIQKQIKLIDLLIVVVVVLLIGYTAFIRFQG